ncbi:glycosyltransferase [Prochlorococcus sp. MIT 1223]|uniref:glycosyltransferase n=1 Tax=Prochlorococcus sp. MIT 1223 TaxID=3096217 RepID=UPI002A75047E|nr:glycosyltransferase [Prochlorococcus sp. MIT 1223]
MKKSDQDINFIISCRTLISFQGHDYNYCKSLQQEAKAKGWKVLILANKHLSQEIVNELGAIPFYKVDLGRRFNVPLIKRFLPKKIYKFIYLSWNFLLHNIFTYYDLKQIDKYLEKSKKNIIFFPTMTIVNIFAIIKYLESIAHKFHFKVGFVNHFTSRPNYQLSKFPDNLHKFLYNQINNSIISKRIYLFSDTNKLSDEFSVYTSKKIEVLPIPHVISQKDKEETQNNKSIRVGYMGDARTSKGFDLLPDVIEIYSNRNQGFDIQFLLQCSIRVRMENKVLEAINLLDSKPNVTLFRNSLSPIDYENLLNSIDIFLLPYSRNRYHSQTSGIFCEARSLGKCFVVPNGTWMSDEIEEFGGGYIFNSHTSESIEAALSRAIKNKCKLSEDSQRRSIDWKRYHNSENYFKVLSESLINHGDIF